jgi:hypothetical protein
VDGELSPHHDGFDFPSLTRSGYSYALPYFRSSRDQNPVVARLPCDTCGETAGGGRALLIR